MLIFFFLTTQVSYHEISTFTDTSLGSVPDVTWFCGCDLNPKYSQDTRQERKTQHQFLFLLNNRRMKQVFLYLTELSDRHCRQLINTNGWITKCFHYQLLCKRTVPLAAVTTTVQGKSPDRSSVDVSSVPVNWFDNRQRWAPVGPQCVWSTCVCLCSDDQVALF